MSAKMKKVTIQTKYILHVLTIYVMVFDNWEWFCANIESIHNLFFSFHILSVQCFLGAGAAEPPDACKPTAVLKLS